MTDGCGDGSAAGRKEKQGDESRREKIKTGGSRGGGQRERTEERTEERAELSLSGLQRATRELRKRKMGDFSELTVAALKWTQQAVQPE